jgi:hypothetical protein
MSWRLVALMTALLLVAAPGGVAAQSDASLGFGLGTVRFPGGPSAGALWLGPALFLGGPGRDLAIGGTLAALPSSDGYAQEGHVSARVETPPLIGRGRLAAEAQVGGANSGRSTASGAAQVALEAILAAPRWGVALATGPASGWIVHELPVTAWRARLRGWWQQSPGRLQFFASGEPTRFLDAWFTDLSGGLALRSGRLEARLSGSGRLSRTYESRGAALAAAEVRLSPAVSLEAAGGNVLPDPYQGFPASGFVTVGVRVHFSPRTSRPDVVVRSRTFSAFRRDDGVLVRVRLRDAQVVAIAGDWNGWTPAPLERTAGDVWESTFPLGPGLHRFVVFVDGTAWQIPEGVPSVPDGMGGRVAVLTVF